MGLGALEDWVARLLADTDLAGMGHAQRPEHRDLGLGWLYYGLARTLKPQVAVVIGSWRGFVPMVLARALADEGAGGRVVFIDPSMVDGFWREPGAVRAHFARFGLRNIEHHCMTTQEFAGGSPYRALPPVDLVFIDGYHTREQARIDFDAFRPLAGPRTAFLFHDSIRARRSRIYGPGREYHHSVCELMDELRGDAGLQVFDLPLGDGLTLVRQRGSPEALLP